MRELTRSMIRFSWAMPLLGVNQMANLVTPGKNEGLLEPISASFEALSDAAYGQMSPRLRDLYDQGDRLQSRVVDAVFGVFGSGGDGGGEKRDWKPGPQEND